MQQNCNVCHHNPKLNYDNASDTADNTFFVVLFRTQILIKSILDDFIQLVLYSLAFDVNYSNLGVQRDYQSKKEI